MKQAYWTTAILGGGAVIILATGCLVAQPLTYIHRQPVTTFKQCVVAGQPVMESYPRQCLYNGQTFVEQIGNALELQDRIRVTSPKPTATIFSPLIIEGEAVGSWYFEASFPARLADGNDFTLAVFPVMAQGEWMTESFVPFRMILPFAKPSTATGTFELHRDNPSGLPENDAVLKIPVRFSDAPTSSETMATKIFLSDNEAAAEPPYDCSQTVAVDRLVPKTDGVARAALEALLRGPSEKDVLAGYSTGLPAGVELNSLVIDNGVARVDFSKQLEYQIGGSCRVTAIRAQITDTLRQWPTVTSVVISIDGRVDDILQP